MFLQQIQVAVLVNLKIIKLQVWQKYRVIKKDGLNFVSLYFLNPFNPELNPICYLLALLAHHFLHVSRIRVKILTLRRLMSYIYIWSTHS